MIDTALADLGRRLTALGLTERAVKQCFGVPALAHLPRALPHRSDPGDKAPRAAAVVWLLCAGRAFPLDAMRELFGADLARLADLGVLAIDGARVHARYALAPLGGGIAVCDRLDHAGADAVMWPDDSSHHLVGALPLARVARWLDVGSGAAIVPIAAPGRATAIRASDVAPRAIELAALGVALSGLEHVTLRVADLCAGAGGEWNLITFNAPIPAEAGGPAGEPAHRRAPAGARVLERFWAEARDAVSPTGEVIVHSWVPNDPLALTADLPGAVAVMRYAREPGFAITAWRPGAPPSRKVVDVTLTEAAPHVVRVDVDRALAG
ncbi:MAG: methyltransferase [Deltaproteobacteria bacterium]|nr:methyltransferase [Deltaproteobacteria bacterium]